MLNLCLLSIGVFDTFDTVTCEGVGFTEIDRIKYDEGKKQYELVESKSRMPQYGTCWKSALAAMQAGCKLLTDDIQSRLALAYLNCFLEVQGRPTHECDASMAFKDCIYFLDDSDRGSLTTFSRTHKIFVISWNRKCGMKRRRKRSGGWHKVPNLLLISWKQRVNCKEKLLKDRVTFCKIKKKFLTLHQT